MIGRWTPESARDYRIGLVVDAMVTGKATFFRYQDSVRGQLDRDLRQLYAKAGNPPDGLPKEDVVTALNNMRHGLWRKWNGGKGLTEDDLSRLLKRPSTGELRGIRTETEVRTCFPNLPSTRNPAAKRRISICDAVAEVLAEEGQPRTYDAVVSMWKRYRTEQPVL